MLLRVLDQDLINLLVDIIGLFDLSGNSARLPKVTLILDSPLPQTPVSIDRQYEPLLDYP
jgi:hypothetical protein